MTISAKPFAYMPPPLIDDPGADEWTEPFWKAAANDQLVAPRCIDCGTFRMPPGRFCVACLSQQVEWVPLPGTGSVHTFTVVRTSPLDEAVEYLPYIPAAVEADGAPGIHFVSNIVDCPPDDVTLRMRVQVVWYRANDVLSIPLWTPESAARS